MFRSYQNKCIHIRQFFQKGAALDQNPLLDAAPIPPRNAIGIDTIRPHGHAATRMINPRYIHSDFASINIIGGRRTVSNAIRITIGVYIW